MELKKIEKKEVHFMWDSFAGHYMRISAKEWYVKGRVTGDYYLESLISAKKLEDSFQNKEKDPTTGEREEWYVVPPYGNEGWHVLNERGELVATFETKEECIKAVNAVNRK